MSIMMNLYGRHILVTGGAGFIGSHLTEALVAHNRVTVYDNFSSSVIDQCYLGNLGNVRVISGDILDKNKLERAMKGIDIVFHLAVACVRMSLAKPAFVHDVNATGTLAALLASKKNCVKLFIYISSSEIYGTLESRKIKESHRINPTTVYGMSKYIGELYAKHFNDHEGLPTMVVRPFNTYGPRSHFEGVYGEVVPRFVVRALNGKQPIIFGSGRQTRDFTYVTDTVKGIILAAGNDKLVGDTINIARGQEVSILDIAKTICKIAGLPFQPIMKQPRPNDVVRHFADISYAKQVLNFKPEVTIKHGLREYVAWIRKTYPDAKQLLSNIPDINW